MAYINCQIVSTVKRINIQTKHLISTLVGRPYNQSLSSFTGFQSKLSKSLLQAVFCSSDNSQVYEPLMFIFLSFFQFVEISAGLPNEQTSTKKWSKNKYTRNYIMKRWIHIELCLARNFTPMCGFLKQVPNTQYETVQYLGENIVSSIAGWALRLSLHKTGKVIFVIKLGSRFPGPPSVAPSPSASTTTSTTPSFSRTSATPSSSGVGIEYELETIHQVLLS